MKKYICLISCLLLISSQSLACDRKDQETFRVIKDMWGLGSPMDRFKDHLKNAKELPTGKKTSRMFSIIVKGESWGLIFRQKNGKFVLEELLSPHFASQVCEKGSIEKEKKEWGRKYDLLTEIDKSKGLSAYSWICNNDDIKMRYTIENVIFEKTREKICVEKWALL